VVQKIGNFEALTGDLPRQFLAGKETAFLMNIDSKPIQQGPGISLYDLIIKALNVDF
jgi:hypothetical protein